MSGKWEQLVEEGSITNKNPVLVKHAYNEIISTSKQLVKEEEARRAVVLAELERKAEEQRGDHQFRVNQIKLLYGLLRRKKKAVLFEYQGVKNINAEIVLNRPVDMKLLEKL